ncbi:Domain of unknown function DUF1713, mitochondria [Ostreococcus tauri]|uniref:Ribosomal protein mS38 C-terminal domain-containing protein n=1 Tax=Ostreococcus tauri TaxID=70448 RepID=A0A090MCC7_OSTTA|nr:Domain of unknown function DUF1713, mitochondria [Ostreococcus tauri]OUS43149.1 hypothetical protein BE221DRAFT_195181 [Ostreococcus tauri]CEF99764.1 Domain of unknown function DUF1713, mitochondria [Ostreococcus tauri]|eukprot:XP_022840019.1 Domain of unknown function DUF1713, mitochondria [Ostreococcus tauri]
MFHRVARAVTKATTRWTAARAVPSTTSVASGSASCRAVTSTRWSSNAGAETTSAAERATREARARASLDRAVTTAGSMNGGREGVRVVAGDGGMTVGSMLERLRAIEREMNAAAERDGGWFSLASVKRKRKKAMNKHKHRKRRRRDRHSNK